MVHDFQQKTYRLGLCAAALLALNYITETAQAFDNNPGDYSARADGTNVATMYARYTTRNSLNLRKVGKVPNSHLDSFVTTGRYAHYFDVEGFLVVPQIFLSHASLSAAKVGGRELKGSTGAVDPLVACQFGLLNQPKEGRFVGIGTGVYLPLGHYQKGAPLNTGENRWKGVVQAALVQSFSKEVRLDLTVDTTVYGDNTAAGNGTQTLSQYQSYQVQPWISYFFTPESAASFGYSKTFGGIQKLNGIANGYQTDAHQLRLEYRQLLTPKLLVGALVSRDFAVSGGFPEDLRAMLRGTLEF